MKPQRRQNWSPTATGCKWPLGLLLAFSAWFGGFSGLAAGQDAGETPSPPPQPQVEPSPPPEDEPAGQDPAEPPTPEAEPEAPLPEARELIEQSRAAIGNPEKVAALQSVSIKATLTLPTGENYFNVKSMRNNAFRFEQRTESHPGVVVYFDGKVGWIAHSDLRYELVDEFTLERGRHQFNAMFPLWQALFPEEHFQSFQTVERTTFNERECFKVQMNADDTGKMQRFAYFDVEDKIIRGMTVTQQMPDGEQSVHFRFEEWKPFDEIKVFTKLSIDQPNQPLVLTYTQIEFNTVDAAMFEQPTEVKDMVRERDTPPPPPPPPVPAELSPDAEEEYQHTR